MSKQAEIAAPHTQANAPRTIGCGCCSGIGIDPNRDRCICHIHQDRRIGIRPHVCAYHKESAAEQQLEAA